jgi:hypothetical protein
MLLKPATLEVLGGKTCTIFPMIPSRYHEKKRNKIVGQFKRKYDLCKVFSDYTKKLSTGLCSKRQAAKQFI